MKAAIIGSGIAGLATAIRLAKRGMAVDLFEANAYCGGKLTVIQRDGFTWDAGPSLFTMPHFVDELLSMAGLNGETFTYRKMDEACRYFWEDGTTVTAHADGDAFAKEMEAKLNVKASTVRAALYKAKELHEATSPLFLEQSLHKATNFLNGNALKAMTMLPRFDLHRTMHNVNKARFRSPKAVQLFDRFATYNGSDPYRAPGVLNVIPHLEHNVGTFLPRGGMHSITKALEKAAIQLGVRLHLNAPVERIVVENGKATGVWVNGKHFEADIVVSNMDVVPTYRKLLRDQKAPEEILKQERSSSALIFYWGVKGQSTQLGLHNILFSDDYAREFNTLFNQKDIAEDPTVYVNITSKYERGHAPDGHENWFVMINAPANEGQDWNAIIDRTRTNVINKLSGMLGRDLRSDIVCEELLDPRSIESKTSSHMGSLYGASSNHWRSAFLRHPNFKQEIKGLYFCGGSAHPGGGIPLCLLSARIVDQLIVN